MIRKQGQTHKQHIKQLEDEIKRLQELCFFYMKMSEDLKSSTNTVHISELEKRQQRIDILVGKVIQLGAYCGD
jgi:hypothetical protein